MTINLTVPDLQDLKPRIVVFGVGGAGGNAVNNMIESRLEGVEFVVANTDAQALMQNAAQRRVQMGTALTQGLGAGSQPQIGAAAAEEALPEILDHLVGSHMAFITAGMGGGTGTGAAPVIARIAREMGILTVGVVTKPFEFEGGRRGKQADAGVSELEANVDSLIVVLNEKLLDVMGEDVTQETFSRELSTLIGQWGRIHKKQRFVGAAPKLLHRETSLTRGIIRDLFSSKVDKLTVDSKQIHNEIIEYLKGIAPELIERVVLHEDKVPLFDKAEVETEIRDLFKRRCDLPSGGYLIIEPTEALVSIDVNSGRYTGKKDPEKTSLRTNIEAAREVARQLRLRDIGGIIVVDFIDMVLESNRDAVLRRLVECLGRDRTMVDAGWWTRVTAEVGLIDLRFAPNDLGDAITAARLFAGYAGWGGGQLETEVEGESVEIGEVPVVGDRRADEQHGVGPHRPRLVDLDLVDHEVLAEHRESGGLPRRDQMPLDLNEQLVVEYYSR